MKEFQFYFVFLLVLTKYLQQNIPSLFYVGLHRGLKALNQGTFIRTRPPLRGKLIHTFSFWPDAYSSGWVIQSGAFNRTFALNVQDVTELKKISIKFLLIKIDQYTLSWDESNIGDVYCYSRGNNYVQKILFMLFI